MMWLVQEEGNTCGKAQKPQGACELRRGFRVTAGSCGGNLPGQRAEKLEENPG